MITQVIRDGKKALQVRFQTYGAEVTFVNDSNRPISVMGYLSPAEYRRAIKRAKAIFAQ